MQRTDINISLSELVYGSVYSFGCFLHLCSSLVSPTHTRTSSHSTENNRHDTPSHRTPCTVFFSLYTFGSWLLRCRNTISSSSAFFSLYFSPVRLCASLSIKLRSSIQQFNKRYKVLKPTEEEEKNVEHSSCWMGCSESASHSMENGSRLFSDNGAIVNGR